MKRSKALFFTSLILLLFTLPLIGACTPQEVVRTVPVEKTLIQTQTVPVEKTVQVEKTVLVKEPLRPLPDIFQISGPDATTPGPQIIAIADQLSKQLGKKVVVQNPASYLELVLLAKIGQSLMIGGGTTSVMQPFLGIGDFAETEGPQALRTLVVGTPRFWGFYTTKKTGIKTMEDVKGKRVPYYPDSMVRNITTENVFKSHGFTFDDVKKVNFAGSSEAQQGLLDGMCDIVLSGFPTPKLIETDAIMGAYIIPFSGTPEMRRIWAELQPHELLLAPKGIFPGVEADIVLPGSVDHYAAYEWLDEDWAYQLTKAIYEGIPALQKVAVTEGMTQEFAARIPSSLAFHTGAIKYYKEIGIWTAEHDKFQQERLETWQAARDAWKAKHPAK